MNGGHGRERLLRLEEIEATRGLLSAYARAADAASIERMLALFTRDGVVSNRLGEFAGLEEIGDYFTRAWGADPVDKRHFVANVEAQWSGPGRVRAQAYFLFVARAPGSSALGWGTYDAHVRVHDAEARFTHLRMDLDVGTDLAAGWSAG